MPRGLHIHDRVARAIAENGPVVALETAVATHGLPLPHAISVVEAMEREVQEQGAEPAICVVSRGELHVGAPLELVRSVASDPHRVKASIRDLGHVMARHMSAGLTVSATVHAATLAGIAVFATGGIGGVHQGAEFTGDESADLLQLSRHPILTVCSGAKSVLDVPRTLERLESLGVPTFAYQSSYFPAFYLRSSGIATPSLDSAWDAANVARCHWNVQLKSAVIVGNPLPDEHALDPVAWDTWLMRARSDASERGITGKDVTPFLLAQVAEYSNGLTVTANIELLTRNARLAGEIAGALAA
ncbi:MAG: pseudouridine-5'-phosphate glycosidase [Chloroflexota bacterium]